MSDFWVPSDPPETPALVEWCKAEVEHACRDSWKHLAIAAGSAEGEGDGTPAIVLWLDGPWDEEILATSSVGKILDELAEDGSNVDGVVVDVERIEDQLAAVERKIAQIRARYVS